MSYRPTRVRAAALIGLPFAIVGVGLLTLIVLATGSSGLEVHVFFQAMIFGAATGAALGTAAGVGHRLYGGARVVNAVSRGVQSGIFMSVVTLLVLVLVYGWHVADASRAMLALIACCIMFAWLGLLLFVPGPNDEQADPPAS